MSQNQTNPINNQSNGIQSHITNGHTDIHSSFLNQEIQYNGTTKIGSREEILKKMQEKYTQKNIQMLSFYSSELEMIVEDPALMNIPIDDRILNRGHGIFESMAIKKGKFFSVEQHLERLKESANSVGIELPVSTQKLQKIMQDMAILSYQKLQKQFIQDGKNLEELEKLTINLRILVSSGRNDFGIYSYGKTPIIYASTFVNLLIDKSKLHQLSEGIHEFSVDEERIKRLETAKSTAYLQNCVIADISKAQGGYQGLKLNHQGQILEQAMANVAYFNKNTRYLHLTPPECIIAGTTLKKVLQNFIEPVLGDEKNKNYVKGVKVQYFTAEEIVQEGAEFMSFGGDKVLPILSIDGKQVGTGTKGPICQEIQNWYKSLTETQGDHQIPFSYVKN